MTRLHYAVFRFRGFDRKLRRWLDDFWDARPFTRFERPPSYGVWLRRQQRIAAATAHRNRSKQ